MILVLEISKNFSKNVFSFFIIELLIFGRLLSFENLEILGKILLISVPFSFICPSLKQALIYLYVSSEFKFDEDINSSSSSFL
jgi:hypothetical protein